MVVCLQAERQKQREIESSRRRGTAGRVGWGWELGDMGLEPNACESSGGGVPPGNATHACPSTHARCRRVRANFCCCVRFFQRSSAMQTVFCAAAGGAVFVKQRILSHTMPGGRLPVGRKVTNLFENMAARSE